MTVLPLQNAYRPDAARPEAPAENATATPETDEKVQANWREYLPELTITTDVSYQVIVPKCCNRKWVVLTAAAMPVVGFSIGYYLDFMNKSS